MHIIGDVEGKNVLMVDDMITTPDIAKPSKSVASTAPSNYIAPTPSCRPPAMAAPERLLLQQVRRDDTFPSAIVPIRSKDRVLGISVSAMLVRHHRSITMRSVSELFNDKRKP